MKSKTGFTFKGGFGEYSAECSGHHATIRACGFGRIKRFQVWVDGGLPRAQCSTFTEAKAVANRVLVNAECLPS